MLDSEILKKDLEYVILNKSGTMESLYENISKRNAEGFYYSNFIEVYHNKKWKINDLAKRYYIDVFGFFNYCKVVFKSLFFNKG